MHRKSAYQHQAASIPKMQSIQRHYFLPMKSPFDEMLDATGKARPHYKVFHGWLKQQSDSLMGLKRAEADLIFRRVGITFAVYGDDLVSERTIPFDQAPRIFAAKEWEQLEAADYVNA